MNTYTVPETDAKIKQKKFFFTLILSNEISYFAIDIKETHLEHIILKIS